VRYTYHSVFSLHSMALDYQQSIEPVFRKLPPSLRRAKTGPAVRLR
jgi:hypothetical protein